MSTCSFCEIVNDKREASFVYRDADISAFMDIQPINPGHLLIVPNRHCSGLGDLDPEVGAMMFRLAQRMADALRRSGIRCEGVNLFLCDGEAAWQDVFHVHLVVIPRFKGDGFDLVLPEDYQEKTPRPELDRAAEKIRGALEP